MTEHTPPEPADRADGGQSPPGTLTRRRLLQSGAALGAGAALGTGTSPAAAHEVEGIHVLVFSETEAFRHGNIEHANEQLQAMAARLSRESGTYRSTVEFVGDPDGEVPEFPSTVSELEHYDVVVWNNTTGSPLDADQRAAFEEYVRDGGGYVGIHAAADTHYDWAFYEELVGAQFQSHPAVQEAEIAVTDREHPSTAHLPDRWIVEDEWYDFDRSPRGDAHVLATLEEDSYDGAEMENGRADHPIAWCQEIDDGRSWYTGRGHTEAAFDEEAFQIHLARGILWAGGYSDGTATATTWDAYDRVELTTDVSAPSAVEIAPDGRAFVVDAGGELSVVDPESGETTTALALDVSGRAATGAYDLAFDPDFEENGHLYLYYAPAEDQLDPDADQPYDVLARFAVDGDGVASDTEIDSDTEVELLRVPTQRAGGGAQDGADLHSGGGVEFGPDGHLYLSVGDGVAPNQDGFAPLDESTDPNWTDARGTAGDTSDLRGSILRITPQDDGGYAVPDDNPFTAANGYGDEVDAGTVRPELYATGLRNPRRFDVDPETGWLYVGDTGPESEVWNADRGPLGLATYDQLREPANLGWPFARLDLPYVDYDAEASETGVPFDLDGPVNDSVHNDGLEQLPAIDTEATLFYAATDWEAFVDPAADGPWATPDEAPHPEVEDTEPIGGPLIRLDEVGDGGLPQYFDGKWLVANRIDGTLHLASFDDSGDLLDLEPFLPDLDVGRPNDLAVGPDGRLFLAGAGTGPEGQAPALYRVDHVPTTVPDEVATAFELEGETGGWQGVAPAEIEGETNPTLSLEPGQRYRVTWTNADGLGHNFAVRDADENALLSTDVMQIIGETQTVEFTASEEMDHYVCQPHEDLMHGDVSLGHPCSDVGAAAGEQIDGQTVCDVDGDGSYRDVTGDGSVTNTDVTEFFSNQHASPWDDRADLFDFDGDDEVRQGDVIALFEYVTA